MDMLLDKLISSYRVSGREKGISNIIKEELKKIGCEFEQDLLGNLIVKRGQGQEKLMICANMDTSGFIVTYIEDKGVVRVNAVGNIEPKSVVGTLVKFESGAIGRVCASKDSPSINDLFIDLGLSSKEEVLKKVKEGDTATLVSFGFETEDKIVDIGLDNAVGCYILLKLLKEVKDFNKEVYFVFSSQGVLGGRGSRAAAYEIEPNNVIVISSEQSGDYIGSKGNVKLGNGPVIRIKDKALIMCQDIKAMLENAANISEVDVQYVVSTEASEGGLHKEREGISTGVLALPIRYKNTLREMMSKVDIDNTIKLLKVLL